MDEIKVGDKVRKRARRNHRGSGILGTVEAIYLVKQTSWARVRSGNLVTAWPTKLLLVLTVEDLLAEEDKKVYLNKAHVFKDGSRVVTFVLDTRKTVEFTLPSPELALQLRDALNAWASRTRVTKVALVEKLTAAGFTEVAIGDWRRS